jgi:hypothetical protein
MNQRDEVRRIGVDRERSNAATNARHRLDGWTPLLA